MAAKTKVAIIEDDLPIVQMYRAKFENEGYDVQTATDGHAGLELLSAFQPDVVLLDLMMPRMNGIELLGHIKRDDHINPKAIVVLTNLGSSETANEIRGLPVTDYIVKADLTPKQVVERVSAILARPAS